MLYLPTTTYEMLVQCIFAAAIKIACLPQLHLDKRNCINSGIIEISKTRRQKWVR